MKIKIAVVLASCLLISRCGVNIDNPMFSQKAAGSWKADSTYTELSTLRVNFTDNEGKIYVTKRIWDFGDKSTVTTADSVIEHAYPPGLYTVTLTVETPAGVTTTSQSNLISVGKVKAKFACLDFDLDNATFKVNSSGPVSVDSLDFGDGDHQIVIGDTGTVTHKYGKIGPFQVSLNAFSIKPPASVSNVYHRQQQDSSLTVLITSPQPWIELSDTLNFGVVETGSTKDTTFHIMNAGEGDLVIDSIKTDSTEFTVTSITQTTVSGGAKYSCTVQFSPKDTTSITSTLTIYNDSRNKTKWLINLQGKGKNSSQGGLSTGIYINGRRITR